MRMRKRNVVISLLLCVVMTIGLLSGERVNIDAAAVTGQEVQWMLLDPVVGRYQINYIGNTNHYAFWTNDSNPADKFPMANVIYHDIPGFENSSTATLHKAAGVERIVRAFLVWETRAPQGVTDPIYFIYPGGGQWIYPDWGVNDWRYVGGEAFQTMYCMATDVTSLVKDLGYGDYSVCNIPRWTPTWEDRGGGESPGSWQLIVIEEGDALPVRVASLMMGAEFRADFVPSGKDYSSTLTFGKGLKSKSFGNATGQFFFGASNSSSSAPMTGKITTYNDSGKVTGTVNARTTCSPGLYRNGSLVNSRDDGNGCIRMDLSDVGSVGNRAERVQLDVSNDDWSTFFFLGAAVDIAYPNFKGIQTTVVNSETSVTVKGSFQNTASTADTGIYDGRMVVELDSGLTPTNATAIVNGGPPIHGTISGCTVTFGGEEVENMMNGSGISYTIQCSTRNSGKTVFQNHASFQGYLCADGVNTGYWIDRMWTAASSAVPRYKVAVETGTGVVSVTGDGEYLYGSAVNLGAVLKHGYHWKGWTGDCASETKEFTFSMYAKDLFMRAEGEANAYTIVFDTNGGGEVTSIADIVTRYDTDVTLPDGGETYVKYTSDGVNVTSNVLLGNDAEDDSLVSELGVSLDGEIVGPGEEEATLTTVVADTQEQLEMLDGTPRSGRNAYPSVFMGWALADGKDAFTPQWRGGDVVRNLTELENGVVTLYAVWDDCPWIRAEDLYYTLEQAQSGFITDKEILSHAKASDREDGSPIAPGFHENGTSFSIPDYSTADFTQFQHEGAVTENLTVVDSVGSVYSKQITIHIVDTAAVPVKPEGTTRFIDDKYYQVPYESGGLEEESVWRTDSTYAGILQEVFARMENDKPERVYAFTHEEILEMKQFIEENGFGKSESEEAVRLFQERFMAEEET